METVSGNGSNRTFPAIFEEQARKFGDNKVIFREKDLGIWQSYTWKAVLEHAKDLALGLAAMGFKRGDRICIIGDNRPELYWGMLAAQFLGGVPVPIYQDSIEREMQFIIDHAEVRFALVEDQEQVDKMLGIIDECQHLDMVIYKDPRGLRNYPTEHLHSMTWVEEQGQAFGKENPAYLEQEMAKNGPEDVAVISYTSGTTGKPKGVVLTHGNIITASEKIIGLEKYGPDTSHMAYLPIAWVGDFIYSFGMSIVGGFTANCPESADTVLADLREIGPNLFFGPPRIWENILTNLKIRMDDAGFIKRRLFEYFIGLATNIQSKKNRGQAPNLADHLLYQAGKILVYGPLLDNLGLRRVKLAYTAGEAIGPEIFDFFRGLGINIKSFYGSTEAGVFITMPEEGDVRSDSEGRPVPWMDIKINEDGEVLIKGPTVFREYLKNPEATAEAFDEGFFHTGDAGIIDHTGHLRIIDRAKDVSHLKDGTMFAPKYIENKLKFSPYIKEAVAVGQDRDFVTVMINIDPQSVGNWGERRNLAYSSYTDLSQKVEVLDLIQSEIQRVNASLAEEEQLKGAQIRRYLILHKELDPDDEEITRTRKVRRRFIAEKYSDLIAALYSGQDHVNTEAKVTFEDGRTSIVKADLSIREVSLSA